MPLVKWITDDELVGQAVIVETSHGETELATVLGIHPNSYTLRVECWEDGDILIGNQWEEASQSDIENFRLEMMRDSISCDNRFC